MLTYGKAICEKCEKEYEKISAIQKRCNKEDCKRPVVTAICNYCKLEFNKHNKRQICCGRDTCRRIKRNENERKIYGRNIRTQIKYLLKSSISRANMHHIKQVNDLPFTLDQFENHLQKNFKEGMTWQNRGSGGKGKQFSRSDLNWGIGHVLPRSFFGETLEDELKYWSLDNILPEWQWFNHFKGTMDPITMSKWIEDEKIFDKCKDYLKEQCDIQRNKFSQENKELINELKEKLQQLI